MMNKIINLTKVFIKEFYNNLNIFNKKDKKINKKSLIFWLVLIIVSTVTFISYKVINMLVSVGQPQVFLNFYLILLTIFISFQAILTVTNVFFFSKELEFILPMPITSVELLLAKFSTLVFSAYMTEAIFGLIPLYMYGVLAHLSLIYFLLMPIVLLIFPIFILGIISIITVVLMHLNRFIRNKNILQVIITVFLLIGVLFVQNNIIQEFSKNNQEARLEIEKNDGKNQDEIMAGVYEELGSSLVVINPTIKVLSQESKFNDVIINLLKIMVYNVLAIIGLIIVGRKSYLKNVLRGTISSTFFKKKRKLKKININKSKKNIATTYIKKEFKMLLRHPNFFMKTVFPVIIILITAINIGSFVIPFLDSTMESGETIRETFNQMEFDTNMVCIILGIMQVLFSISGLSLTAISREGRNAILMKYIPVDLYNQFLYKNVLQIVLNTLVSVVVLGLTYYLVPQIGFLQIILLFIISIFMSLINSYLMLIVDLRRPFLDWDSEYAVMKRNDNKLFQYVFLILTILFLMYIAKVLKGININIAIISEIFIFMVLFIILDRVVKKNCSKIFNKIV